MVNFFACTRCKCSKPVDQFNWKVKNIKRSPHCKTCSREYVRHHYANHTNYYLLKARERNHEHKQRCIEIIAKHLLQHPCVDCGETNILVLEFDHQNRNEKFDEISHIIRRRLTTSKLKIEMAKYQTRCANCHRIKTEKENNSWKLKYAPVA